MEDQPSTRGRLALAAAGLGLGPAHARSASTSRFADDRPFRVEIASVEGPEALATVLRTAQLFGVKIDRVSQGSGVMLQTDDEIQTMLAMGAENDVEVCLFVGPRGSWDIGVQATTTGGRSVASALRGNEQLSAAVEELHHGCELGLRSVLVSDVGLLWILGRLRASGDLPPDLRLKVSASFPVSNPATARLLEDLGANTLNIVVDLTVDQIAAIREATSLPLDIYVEAPDDLGAPMRYYDVPEIVRTAAPVYLKFAVRNAAGLYPYGQHLRNHLLDTAAERVRRAALAIQLLDRIDGQTKPGGAQAPGDSLSTHALDINDLLAPAVVQEQPREEGEAR